MLAACPAGPPPGVLAFAAVAAHFAGDGAEARRHADALLDITRAAGDDAFLEVASEVLTWTHPQEAAEIAERYAADHRKREGTRLVHDMASLEAGRQAAKREIEAAFAAEEDGGRAAAEMLQAMHQRVLEAPSVSLEDMRRDQARLAEKTSGPLRPFTGRLVLGAYLDRAFTELSARLSTSKDTADPNATGKAS